MRAWRPMSDTSRGRSSNARPKAHIFGAPEGAFRVWPLHRRSRRHPATVSTNLTPPLGQSLARALRLLSRSRDNDTIRFSISNGRLRFDPQTPSTAIQARHLSRCQDITLISGDPPCFRSKPSARRLSTNAWTAVNAVFVPKSTSVSGPCGSWLPFFSSRRQVEIAPESASRQGWQERLIHFSPDQLWRSVDNSTLHRIGGRFAGTRTRSARTGS